MEKGFLNNKTVLVSGATGLIGKELVKYIFADSPRAGVIAIVRDREKADRLFGELKEYNLEFIESDICRFSPCRMEVDYIIHGASQTSSKAFVNEPVETIMTAITGTVNMLETARLSSVRGFVYLSTMEVYGAPLTDDEIFEDSGNNIDSMNVRSCYPESKRICENLCASYADEYNVKTKIARLTQTFGRGVEYNDGRVFAQFARCAIEGKDIVLKTKGATKRCYLYTLDAVKAILTIMTDGKVKEAYNVANSDTYCSIFEMADCVAQKYGISVRIEEEENVQLLGYAPTLCMNLNTDKLKQLGWRAETGLEEMYQEMIEDMKNNKISL